MVTNISSPFIAPDNSLLNVNSTTGLLQLKPGTQGDLLYAGASGVWATLGTGTVGQLLKAGGAGVNPSWATIPAGEWNLIATLNPSAVTNVTASSLAAYDAYRVVGRITGNTGTNTTLGMQFNGDTGANYEFWRIATATWTEQTAQTQCNLTDYSQNQMSYFEAQFAGKQPGTAAASISIQRGISGGATGVTSSGYTGGWWSSSINTQINAIKFLGTQNFTGVILVFGRNDLH